MVNESETLTHESERTPAAYRRDLHRARLVIGQLRDDALASGQPFQVADLALDAAALDELWDGSTGWTPTSAKRNRSAIT